MFACLLLPNFRLQAVLRWREAESCRSFVLEEDGILVEVNDRARERGIVSGGTSSQAMARDGGVQIFSPDPVGEASLSDLLAEEGLGLSSEVERTAPGVVTVDLRRAMRGICWQQMADGIVTRWRDRALVVRVGVAGTPDLARLAAEGARPSAIVYQAAAYVATLPLETLHPSESVRVMFQDWRLRTVGDLLRLPRAETLQRLGAEGERIFARISGRHRRPLRLLRTVPEYRAAFRFEYEVATTEPLLFLLRRFLEELTERLRGVHRVVREMVLRIPLDDGTCHERVFGVPAPTSEVECLFRILHTHLEALRLSQCPVGVQLRLVAVDPARDQLQLFDRALRDPNQFGETLARLKALLGDDQVGVPVCRDTYEPDQWTIQGLFVPVEKTGSFRPTHGLPLRRYRPAARSRVETQTGHPTWVSFRSIRGRICQWAGPFRLSGRWWEPASWAVEEWDVALENGGLYRIARRGEEWTVEGCYDECISEGRDGVEKMPGALRTKRNGGKVACSQR